MRMENRVFEADIALKTAQTASIIANSIQAPQNVVHVSVPAMIPQMQTVATDVFTVATHIVRWSIPDQTTVFNFIPQKIDPMDSSASLTQATIYGQRYNILYKLVGNSFIVDLELTV